MYMAETVESMMSEAYFTLGEWDRVSLYSHNSPETYYVDQADLHLESAGTKGALRHTWS